MSRAEKEVKSLGANADRVAEYVAEIVAQAPPITSDARARLAALLGSIDNRSAA